MQNLLTLINQKAIAAYGSASYPDYSFVNKVFRRQPYTRVMAGIKTRFKIDDITEPNYDVSFSYIIKSDKRFLLQLSMVDVFFILFRFDIDKKLINTENEPASDDVEFILQTLRENNFIRIDESLVKLLTDLKDVESGHKLNVYQALFTFS